MKRILVIAPHADDSELWAGASIARWVREGHEVRVITLVASNGRSTHCYDAMCHLGVGVFRIAHHPDTMLHSVRHLIRDEIEGDGRLYRPSLVLCPSSHDMHQDHRTVYEEAFRAFRGVSTLGFDVPYNSHAHAHTYYVSVTEDDLERKIKACACYKSEAHKRYMQPEQIRSLAQVRGAEARVPLAEAFELIRMIE